MNKIIKNNLLLYKMYYKYDKYFVIFKLFSSVLQIIQPLSSVLLFKLFLDGIFVHKSLNYCIFIIGILILINFLSQIISVLLNNRFAPISNEKVSMLITKSILEKYLNIDFYRLNNPEFYNKYTQIINDIPTRAINMQETVSKFIGNILSLTTIITLMYTIDPIMIIITILSIIGNIIITPMLNKIGYLSYLEKTLNNRKQNYIKRVFYIFDYLKELKIYSIDKLLFKKFELSNLELMNTIKKFSVKNVILILTIGIINLLSFSIILFYLAYRALNGLLSIGDVSALYNATEQLKAEALSFFSVIPQFIENALYVDNYLSFMNEQDYDCNHEGIALNTISSIDFIKVSFSYSNDENYTLKNINLSIKNNEKIAIVGHNGAGKSTFVNLLTRLYSPSQGIIKLNEKKYSDYNYSSVKENIMVIFQDSQMYALSIAENVLLHEIKTDNDKKIVEEALKKVGLYNKVVRYKNGINAILTKEFDDEGIVFSGGEIQKLFVARILASKAKIIVLDEVTSNMDAISEHNIFDEIINYCKDKIVTQTSHMNFSYAP